MVPVVMAKLGVEMNGALIPEDEFVPESWNGAPVTFGHPVNNNGDEISANAPEVLDEWSVGMLFDASYNQGKLKADAWVNVQQAEALRPGAVDALESGEQQIDVSTGYFSRHSQQEGVVIHTDLKPDHLAILFDVPGACSFEDGCGVRANHKRGGNMPESQNGGKSQYKSRLASAIETINNHFRTNGDIETNAEETFEKRLQLEANRRGRDDDFRQMVADLVSMEDSPFVPDDMFGMMDLTVETMLALKDTYNTTAPDTNSGAGGEETGGTEDNTDGADGSEAPAGADNEEGQDMPEGEKPNVNAALSEEDRAALTFARNQYAEHRTNLVKTITANSDMTEEQLKAMDVNTLETICNGLRPAGDYSARATAGGALETNADEHDAESAKSMEVPDITANFQKREGK